MSDEYDWDNNPEGLIDWSSIHKSSEAKFNKIKSLDLSKELPENVKAKLALLHGDVIIIEVNKLKEVLGRE